MKTATKDVIRRCRFTPYRKGMGPTFTLVMWDTHRTNNGKCILGYRLTMKASCVHPVQDKATCGNCQRSWCFACDPCPSALCHWCNGRGHSNAPWGKPVETVLFEGEDLGCSPMHAIDSDESVAALMGFLTLRPGDTDAEYFENYTPEQMEFCQQHAESLSCEVQARFGDE